MQRMKLGSRSENEQGLEKTQGTGEIAGWHVKCAGIVAVSAEEGLVGKGSRSGTSAVVFGVK